MQPPRWVTSGPVRGIRTRSCRGGTSWRPAARRDARRPDLRRSACQGDEDRRYRSPAGVARLPGRRRRRFRPGHGKCGALVRRRYGEGERSVQEEGAANHAGRDRGGKRWPRSSASRYRSSLLKNSPGSACDLRFGPQNADLGPLEPVSAPTNLPGSSFSTGWAVFVTKVTAYSNEPSLSVARFGVGFLPRIS
jgi:hypothetical protein